MSELTQLEQDYHNLRLAYDSLFDQAEEYKSRAEKAEAEAVKLREWRDRLGREVDEEQELREKAEAEAARLREALHASRWRAYMGHQDLTAADRLNRIGQQCDEALQSTPNYSDSEESAPASEPKSTIEWQVKRSAVMKPDGTVITGDAQDTTRATTGEREAMRKSCWYCKGTGEDVHKAGAPCPRCGPGGYYDATNPAPADRRRCEALDALKWLEKCADLQDQYRATEAVRTVSRALTHPCPHVVTSGESRYCALAESQPVAAVPSDLLSNDAMNTLRQMASQQLVDEMTADEIDQADFEGAFDIMVRNSRRLLREVAAAPEPSEGGTHD